MGDPQFNQIIADMYTSENIELILKGEDTYGGMYLFQMTYSEAKQALEDWQLMFVTELESMGFSNVNLPVSYNQLMMEFTLIRQIIR